jgi:pimeloyl-ACP methyl ester carboxylesterase
MRHLFIGTGVALAAAGALAAVPISAADQSKPLLTIDHFVEVKSTAPPIAGQPAVLYVRERRLAGPLPAPAALNGKVALFVHGAGTPAEVSFDVPLGDFSWMAFLARAGFDVFSVDMTGYGRSTRPAQMNDPCNLSADAQKQFIGSVISGPCAPTFKQPTTTLASDWNDVGAAVDYVLNLRHVAKVDLLAWSMGGPRAAGWAAEHPDKVNKMVLLAPAYNRGTPGGAAARGAAPAQDRAAAQAAPGARGNAPAAGAGAGRGAAGAGRGAAAGTAAPAAGRGGASAFGTQSRAEFIANWDRQAPCPGQYEPATRDAVWSDMLASDPVGATWGAGVRRAPGGGGGGGATWTQAAAAKTMIPTLMVSGVNDGQVNPQSVRNLFEDLGAKQKVFIDLACSSHNAMWEKNHLLLFQASLDWLTQTSVNGTSNGMLKVGY